MAARILTVDLGNSRLKLVLWGVEGELPVAGRRLELAANEEATSGLVGFLDEVGPPDLAALSAVGRRALEAEVEAVLRERAGIVQVRPDPGLRVDVARPAEVGSDRLLAARGALAELRRSAIVVDLGTALTVDVVRAEDGPDGRGDGPGGPSGSFLGGAIAPGPELAAGALARGTAGLPPLEPAPLGPPARALGKDTREAIRVGVSIGVRGAARALVEAVALEAELEDAPVVLTGGGRDLLLEPEPFSDREIRVLPDVVHAGLLEATRAVWSARSGERRAQSRSR